MSALIGVNIRRLINYIKRFVYNGFFDTEAIIRNPEEYHDYLKNNLDYLVDKKAISEYDIIKCGDYDYNLMVKTVNPVEYIELKINSEIIEELSENT